MRTIEDLQQLFGMYAKPTVKPAQGSLWYNQVSGLMYIFDGTVWRPVGAP